MLHRDMPSPNHPDSKEKQETQGSMTPDQIINEPSCISDIPYVWWSKSPKSDGYIPSQQQINQG